MRTTRIAVLAVLLAACTSSTSDDVMLSTWQLRYRLDARYTIFFCDPDFWPIVRGDEKQLAINRFPMIAANTEEFSAILAHLGLTGQTTFTDVEKLQIYREEKRLFSITLDPKGTSYAYQLRSQENTNYFLVKGEIDSFGRIDQQDKAGSSNACPICLTRATRIATARGEIPVSAVRAGTLVWSVNESGARVLVPVQRTARVPLADAQQFIRIRLSDGRELLSSPPHPFADGRRLADVFVGDTLAGARVVAVTRAYVHEPATYDLLPATASGVYWANGILLGSTLWPLVRQP